MMKKLIHNILLPFSLFTTAIALIACSEPPHTQLQEASNQVAETSQYINEQVQHANQHLQQGDEILKTGNTLAIVRDIADMQLKASKHLTQLEQTQTALEAAVKNQNTVAFSTAITQLDQQLNLFNQTLEHLHLKSQEIDDIRNNILNTNQKVLNSPLLNEDLNIQEIDLATLESQIGYIKNEMLKLAVMLIHNKVTQD